MVDFAFVFTYIMSGFQFFKIFENFYTADRLTNRQIDTRAEISERLKLYSLFLFGGVTKTMPGLAH